MGKIGLAVMLVLLASTSDAVTVDPDNPQGIAAIYSHYLTTHEPEHYVLCVDGTVKGLQRGTDPKFEWTDSSPYGIEGPVTSEPESMGDVKSMFR